MSPVKKKLALRHKILHILSQITVEPLIFFYILPGTMGVLATLNMNMEKACRVNLGYNASSCDAMVRRDKSGYDPYQEEQVQKLTATMLTVKTAIIGFFPTVLLLFFGSWSDRHSCRKPVILSPIVGDILSYVCLFMCAYFFLELPIVYSTLADAVPFSLGGGAPCVTLGVFSYISDISTVEERTVRIGAVSMFQNVAITVGNAAGGFLIQPLGYKGVYTTSVAIMSFVFLYGYFGIREKQKLTRSDKPKTNRVKDFLDVKHIRNTFKICFKEERKWRMVGMLILTALVIGPFNGETSVVYLYTRIKFEWNEVDYSIFNTSQFLIQICGSLFALSFLCKYLQLDDALIGVLAMFSKISACLLYAFAPSGRFFFIGAILEVFHGTSHIALRSLISKIVPVQELGRSSSVFGACEALMPLAFGPFYSTLYNHTLETFPGTFYLVSASFYTITLFIFFYLYKLKRVNSQQMSKYVEEDEEVNCPEISTR